MNLRGVMIIYSIEDKYMYEILEDYKCEDNETMKDEIFKAFCAAIWSSNNKRRVFKKDIKFKVRNDLLNTEIGQIFNAWSIVTYTGYKPRTSDTEFTSLIRQKVNNIYTNMFDDKVILRKEYMQLIKTPQKLYYRWLKGEEFNSDKLTKIIDNAINEAEIVKEKLAKEKMKVSWNEYKKVVEKYFRKMFDNFISLDEYETKNEMVLTIDTWNEDNYCIRYFCKSLNGYFKDYQKEYYGVKKRDKKIRCINCGKLIKLNNNKQKYCDKCKIEVDRNKAKERMKKIRSSK